MGTASDDCQIEDFNPAIVNDRFITLQCLRSTITPVPLDPLTLLRKLLVGLFMFGLAGMLTELVMLEHYEDAWMIAPLAAIGLSIVMAAAHLVADSARTATLLRALGVVLVALGAIGMTLHFRGSMEFQLEMDPTMSRWDLFWKVLHMKAPPTLAPGSLIPFGLLGILGTFRHPALSGTRSTTMGDRS